jgi:hypothetical protein
MRKFGHAGVGTQADETNVCKTRADCNAASASGSGLAMRRHVMLFGLLVASFAATERAQADCTPATSSANPIINQTVKCTGAGTIITQNGDNGYGERHPGNRLF